MPSLRGNPLQKRAFPERRAANRERAAAPDFALPGSFLAESWKFLGGGIFPAADRRKNAGEGEFC